MSAAPPRLFRIKSFRLTTPDPFNLARFFAEAIGFSMAAPSSIPKHEMSLLGLRSGRARVTLVLGEQHLDLDLSDQPGLLPAEAAQASDLSFQHFAIVVTDIRSLYQKVLALGATPISRGGPVRLPPSAGGVTAVKFRDPQGHPLEFLQFPENPPQVWSNPDRRIGALGVDHSAISVSDAERSAEFYRGCGLAFGSRSLNHGMTQAALDGLDDPEVDVIALQPRAATPHLELLGYRPWRPHPSRVPAAHHFFGAPRLVWEADQDGLLTDPDGHQHLLQRGP